MRLLRFARNDKQALALRFLFTLSALFALSPVPSVLALDPPVAAPKPYAPPGAERFVLSNGVIVYLYENHELPLFDLRIRFHESPADEKPPFAFDLLGSVWRSGGTTHIKPDDLDDRLEAMAASIETSADEESAAIALSCLSRDAEATLDLWADVVLNPAFDAQKLAIAKGQSIEGLKRKNETPNQVGRRAFRDVIYGPNHPYAADPLEADYTRLTRADLMAMHRRIVAPQTAIIAASGDFDRARLLDGLERRFTAWPKTNRQNAAYDLRVSSAAAGRVFLVEKDFSQSRVSVGRLGINRKAPQRFAIEVGDYILGGGGPSRLFAEIRSRRGLAYMVGSFVTRPLGPGMVGVVSQTKAEATVAVIEAILAEMTKFSTTKVSDEELALAKSAIVNSLVFNYDTPFEIASSWADAEFFDYAPEDFQEKSKRILAVTKDEVFDAAKTFYNPSDAKILVVGDPKKFSGKLDVFGPVTVVPLESVR